MLHSGEAHNALRHQGPFRIVTKFDLMNSEQAIGSDYPNPKARGAVVKHQASMHHMTRAYQVSARLARQWAVLRERVSYCKEDDYCCETSHRASKAHYPIEVLLTSVATISALTLQANKW